VSLDGFHFELQFRAIENLLKKIVLRQSRMARQMLDRETWLEISGEVRDSLRNRRDVNRRKPDIRESLNGG
jgi:hypothetical protein